ncbi:MAG: RrF2 family transcriptional regulator [Planctomycetota bacterium]|jgi:Rrf2 family protein
MDVIRRNTDYALRAMVNLTKNWDLPPVPARQLARQEDISYQLTCKLLQKLNKANLVISMMGPKGGFALSRPPSKITLLQVISTIQGPLKLNKCLLGSNICKRRKNCRINEKLLDLQKYIDTYLGNITLDDIFKSVHERKGGTKKRYTKNRIRNKKSN